MLVFSWTSHDFLFLHMMRLETEPQRLEHSLQLVRLRDDDNADAEKTVPWTYALLKSWKKLNIKMNS